MRIQSDGISIDLPSGWEGAIESRDPDPDDRLVRAGRGSARPTKEPPIAHLANFPLPRQRGDYGSGAVERMRSTDVLVCLLEHGPEDIGTPLFSNKGIPKLTPAHFDPASMQRTVEGMSGAQTFFTENGRPFCLYAVLGSHRDRRALVPVINELLSSVVIEPR